MISSIYISFSMFSIKLGGDISLNVFLVRFLQAYIAFVITRHYEVALR